MMRFNHDACFCSDSGQTWARLNCPLRAICDQLWRPLVIKAAALAIEALSRVRLTGRNHRSQRTIKQTFTIPFALGSKF